jgi:hypothetical protein
MLVNDAENLKIKNKNHRNHTGYKILEIFKKHTPEVLISKIIRGCDVIKRIK